ncbi:hypothetical protein Q3G72_028511 [Acer saccharum]|nr:hypothetical protein Q3G72_028511 [Acer saccharum]
MLVPSDCGIALQYLRLAGLKLSDQDGTEMIEDDVANGDKELVPSLLWNMFVHLQQPLLINKSIFEEEICKINETREDAAMLPKATKDELQNVNFICAAIKCDMELLNAARKTMAMMLGGIMQRVNSG